MAFSKTTAPTGLRSGELLSADNSLPERHILIATLRHAAPRLGLSAPVISTLDAMLSCLAPKRNHHTVFASNATLMFRRNGISDRTIRRHAAVLQELGLLVRHDSPNRKRFTKHNKEAGTALRFGFDLSPLFAQLHTIAAMAASVLREQDQLDYLRAKIRTAASQILKADPNDTFALNTLRNLRRKLTLEECEQMFNLLPTACLNAEADDDDQTPTATEMTVNNGQSVRHHHRSNKELIDKNSKHSDNPDNNVLDAPDVTVTDLLNACSEATQFALKDIRTEQDVIEHARTLSPMIGIDSKSYEAAHSRLGGFKAAMTVWAIMQFHQKVKSVGAYFHCITVGSKSVGFDPQNLIRRIAKAQNYAS